MVISLFFRPDEEDDIEIEEEPSELEHVESEQSAAVPYTAEELVAVPLASNVLIIIHSGYD